jgi:hypothetical protein
MSETGHYLQRCSQTAVSVPAIGPVWKGIEMAESVRQKRAWSPRRTQYVTRTLRRVGVSIFVDPAIQNGERLRFGKAICWSMGRPTVSFFFGFF